MPPPTILVIGAGQAGLAAGYHLRSTGLPFLIVDRAARPGEAWRQRYDSLTLFTPRRYSALPGMALPGDPDGFASAGEFADYLARYAAHFTLPLRLGAAVRRLRQDADGGFTAALAGGESLRADRVVVATGAFQYPVVPALAAGADPDLPQLTLADYRRPAQLPPGRILVVGDGASGRDIAAELAAAGRDVILSGGRRRRLLPQAVLGRSSWWWLDRLGLLRTAPDGSVGRAMRRADPFPDRHRGRAGLAERGVVLGPRLTGLNGRRARFADGRSAEVAAIVWAVGYRDDTGWLDIPGAVGPDGRFRHCRGHAPVAGLYHLGRPWQHNRASALVMGAGPDAARLVSVIAASGCGPC
ncbi:flavin-containing monooxygenase [Marinibaculum pumilum]|uniref:Flavin-containing monooxygenase n=1 Tax=Marinibaculum pumilum TaxID=1766165 RepID=A0ABV7L4G8_9PROT